MASKSSPEKEKPTQEKPKLPKVVWTPDADKALLSNLLDHIVVGEIDGKMWHSIAYLMGGEAQGFTHDKISQRYNKALKNGGLLEGQFLAGKDLVNKKHELGHISRQEKTVTLKRLEGKGTTGTWYRAALQKGIELQVATEICEMNDEKERLRKKALEEEGRKEFVIKKEPDVATGEDTVQSGEQVTEGTEKKKKKSKRSKKDTDATLEGAKGNIEGAESSTKQGKKRVLSHDEGGDGTLEGEQASKKARKDGGGSKDGTLEGTPGSKKTREEDDESATESEKET